jgi:DNA-binding transcriptional MerR regulator
MKIGEVAKAAGVSTSRIRFYEKRGLISAAIRGDNGYRDYGGDLVGLLQFIELAQSLGFTLREIAEAASMKGEHNVSCTDAILLLRSKLAATDQLIADVTERRSRIVELIDVLEARQH